MSFISELVEWIKSALRGKSEAILETEQPQHISEVKFDDPVQKELSELADKIIQGIKELDFDDDE